jgi:cysteine synthase B
VVPRAGLEPARCFAPADFESAASTNFATPAVLKPELLHRFAPVLTADHKFAQDFKTERNFLWVAKLWGFGLCGTVELLLSVICSFFAMTYPTIEDAIGKTPLVALQRIGRDVCEARGNVILGKLEGNNPAGSVKDRPALSMIQRAQERGDIKPGDTLIEATSGNTGIALAMAAAIKGYRMILIMPEDLSIERVQTMKAFGAELILTPKSGGMEYARDLAEQMRTKGEGVVLDQFANADNPRVHFETTGPEVWQDTNGRVTHFVSAMGTTGTITGVSRYLKQHNKAVRIVGAQPEEGSRIPGIRKWEEAYLPKIYDPSNVDELRLVSQASAEDMCRRLAREEGIFAGVSAAGAAFVAVQLAKEVENATIVFIVCDRGDRYLSTGVFPS